MLKIDGKNKKVVGIVVECNPFHKGHKRLLKECKKHGDIIVAVMSGNFVQRGEPGVFDKEKRTKDLIDNGVDIVIEIPVQYVLSSAKYFAKGAIQILEKLGFVDYLVFGSKVADVEKLKDYAEMVQIEKFNYEKDSEIKRNLKAGKTYAKALSDVIGEKLSSNDILAIEYLIALDEMKSKILPIAIERKDDLPTATELRAQIKKKVTTNDFTEILNYKILYAKVESYGKDKNLLDDIYLMTKDMRNAIMKTAGDAMTFDERALKLKTHNRTLAYIKRVFFNIILDVRKEGSHSLPLHMQVGSRAIVILGVKDKSLWILKYIKEPFLMSFAPSSYRTFVKKYKKSKEIRQDKNGDFILSENLKTNIFADKIYYMVGKL